jgi:hypothetical protein
VRLCQIAADKWPQFSAAYYQVNLLRLPGHTFVNYVYAWAVERVPSDKLSEWLSELRDLLEWQDADSESAADMESESFMNMMSKG